MVGMNWHCLSLVVTCPKTVDMMLPDPVSTTAVSVVGPCGLMSACGLSVALPDLPGVRLTQVTFSGRFCTAAGPGVGILAGPATESTGAITVPPSPPQLLLIDGYMKSCVGGVSGLKPGAAAWGAGAGAGTAAPGAGAAAGAGDAATGTALAGAGAAAGAASGAGPAACTGSMPVGRCAWVPGSTPGGATCAVAAASGAWANWLTDAATFFDSSGAEGFLLNAWAAAISSWVACSGLPAACWMSGPNSVMAGRPGRPGNCWAGGAGGAAGSADAVGDRAIAALAARAAAAKVLIRFRAMYMVSSQSSKVVVAGVRPGGLAGRLLGQGRAETGNSDAPAAEGSTGAAASGSD